MPMRTQQFLNRHLHGTRLVIRIKRRFQRGAYSRMLNASDESNGERIGIDDPGRRLPALVRPVTFPEPIDPGGPFRRIELGRIF